MKKKGQNYLRSKKANVLSVERVSLTLKDGSTWTTHIKPGRSEGYFVITAISSLLAAIHSNQLQSY